MPYLPSKPPPTSSDDGTALAFYLEDELSRLAMSLLDDIQAVEIRPAHSAPLRPREGMLVYADGTDWNPGFGEGLYTFGSDSAWHAHNNLRVVPRLFTASGTYTPTVGMVYCIIEGVGSGGAGGGVVGALTSSFGGGGGGSGSYSRLVASAATIGVSQAVTIGNAGTGSSGANGGAGSDCSLGSLLVAKGGGGGFAAGAAQMGTGGPGGVAGTGDIAAAGAPGTQGGFNTNRGTVAVLAHPGTGGSSFFGGGATSSTTTGGQTVAGVAAGAYGSGGSGAFSDATATNAAGGNGSKGVIFVTEFIIVS